MPERERQATPGRIRAFLADWPETADGEFTLPMLTGVLRARRPRQAVAGSRAHSRQARAEAAIFAWKTMATAPASAQSGQLAVSREAMVSVNALSARATAAVVPVQATTVGSRSGVASRRARGPVAARNAAAASAVAAARAAQVGEQHLRRVRQPVRRGPGPGEDVPAGEQEGREEQDPAGGVPGLDDGEFVLEARRELGHAAEQAHRLPGRRVVGPAPGGQLRRGVEQPLAQLGQHPGLRTVRAAQDGGQLGHVGLDGVDARRVREQPAHVAVRGCAGSSTEPIAAVNSRHTFRSVSRLRLPASVSS